MSSNTWRIDSVENVAKRVKVGFVGSCEKYYCDGFHGIPMIRTTNLKEYGIDYSDLKYVTKEFHEKNKKSQLRKNDILVARHGENGKACLFKNSIEANCLNVIVIEPDYNKMIPKFIKYLFDSSIVKDQVSCAVVGSVQNVVNTKTVAKITIPVPNIEEQEAITATLACLDDMIELNKRTNTVLEEMAQAIFKQWFVDFDFPNDEGLPYKSSGGEMVDSELGEIPMGWGVGVLSDLGQIVGGSTPSKAHPEYYSELDIAWVTPKDLSSNRSKFISRGAIDISPEGLKNSSAQKMPRGTVLFSSRAPIGYIAIAKNEITTNQGFKSIVPHENIGSAYVYYYLKDKLSLIESRASGSTFKEVSGSVMKKIPALIPQNDVIKMLQKQCNTLFTQQELMEEESSILATVRDILLPKLMYGAIRVPNQEVG